MQTQEVTPKLETKEESLCEGNELNVIVESNNALTEDIAEADCDKRYSDPEIVESNDALTEDIAKADRDKRYSDPERMNSLVYATFSIRLQMFTI